MSDDREGSRSASSEVGEPASIASNERREALIKLGKYAAYATPIVVATMSSALGQGAPVSGPTPPSPPPR